MKCYFILGILGSLFSFLQFASSPILGGISDVYGRKPVMIICLVSTLFILPINVHNVFKLINFRLVFYLRT